MTPPRIPKDINLYGEETYGVHLPYTRRRFPLIAAPATVVTAQASWRDNTSARVRKALEDMLPHDFRMVEGIDVRKYSSRTGNGVLYQVNGESSQLTLPAAVMRVCEVIANR